MNEKDNAGVQFPPPLLFLITFAVGVFINIFLPIKMANYFTPKLLGLIFILLGTFLAFNASATFRKNHTSLIPDKPAKNLVYEGVYKFSRNPMYFSFFLLYSGLAFFTSLIWPVILIPILFYIVNKFIIKKEESYLERKFGREYLTYKENVRRWV